MKNYTVKEIADLLDTNPETVRRWIRDGKLKAEHLSSRKSGNVISEKELNRFITSNPKYEAFAKSILATSVALTGVLPAVGAIALMGIAGGAIASSLSKSKKEIAAVDNQKLVNHIQQSILENQKIIENNQRKIELLKDEIAEAESNLSNYENMLKILESK